MKRTALAVLVALAVLMAPIAEAQMTPGGGIHRGSSGGAYGPAVSMVGMAHSLVVGSDGVLYVLRNGASATSAPAGEVVAIRPSGVIAWTAKLQGGTHRVELAGSFVLVATGPAAGGMGRWPTGGVASSTVVALNAASGSVVWQSSFEGIVSEIEAFAGGTYVLIHAPNVSTTTMPVKRSVAAIDNSGRLVWKVDLD
jgi:outer membrane protein assembly factor BamB